MVYNRMSMILGCNEPILYKYMTEEAMIGKIIMASLMMLGVIKPVWLIKLTEFWKIDRREPSALSIRLTRIISLIAFVIIWFLP